MHFLYHKKGNLHHLLLFNKVKIAYEIGFIGFHAFHSVQLDQNRHVSRSENLGERVVLGGDNVSPLVEIGLSDLPKTGGAKPPSPPAYDPAD